MTDHGMWQTHSRDMGLNDLIRIFINHKQAQHHGIIDKLCPACKEMQARIVKAEDGNGAD